MTTTTTQEDEGLSHPERIALVRRHFQKKGYRVHSGLQFGCELVLYADSPGRVHSAFCVHVPPKMLGGGGGTVVDWRTIQTLVRMMPDLRKTLIVGEADLDVVRILPEGSSAELVAATACELVGQRLGLGGPWESLPRPTGDASSPASR